MAQGVCNNPQSLFFAKCLEFSFNVHVKFFAGSKVGCNRTLPRVAGLVDGKDGLSIIAHPLDNNSFDAWSFAVKAGGQSNVGLFKQDVVVFLKGGDKLRFELPSEFGEGHEFGIVLESKLVRFREARKELEQDQRLVLRKFNCHQITHWATVKS